MHPSIESPRCPPPPPPPPRPRGTSPVRFTRGWGIWPWGWLQGEAQWPTSIYTVIFACARDQRTKSQTYRLFLASQTVWPFSLSSGGDLWYISPHPIQMPSISWRGGGGTLQHAIDSKAVNRQNFEKRNYRAFLSRWNTNTTRISTSPKQVHLLRHRHDFIGGSIFMPSCRLVMFTVKVVEMPLHFTAGHSANIRLPYCSPFFLRPRISWSGSILLILHFPWPQLCETFPQNSAAASRTGRRLLNFFRESDMTPTALKGAKPSKDHQVCWKWHVHRREIANIVAVKNIAMSLKKSYRGYNIDAAI